VSLRGKRVGEEITVANHKDEYVSSGNSPTQSEAKLYLSALELILRGNKLNPRTQRVAAAAALRVALSDHRFVPLFINPTSRAAFALAVSRG
jgi:hypothetical protein